MPWPDIAIGILLVLGAFKGLRRGFVNELAGLVALPFGIAAAFSYRGVWDEWLRERLHLATGTAHVAGIVFYALAAYAIVLALASALSTVAKLPLIGTANAVLGALVGLAKAAVFAWAVLYVALFFPLSQPIREDLRRSFFVARLQDADPRVDAVLRAAVPMQMRPFTDAIFARHRV